MPSSLLTSNKHKVFDALLKQKGINVRQTETIPRSEKADAYPLSFAQQRLWFLDQLEPGKAIYNLPAAVRLSGQLDTSALSRSFDELVRRHESLRTTFKSVDGQPRQIIAEPAALPLPLIDLTGLNVSEREAEVARLVGEEARRPFDLAAGPLLRAKLLQLSNDEHVLLLNMHHIISDGWSQAVLVRELTQLYAAYAAGREPQLPELPIQYADYAVWQQRWLQGPTLEEQLSYWRKQLAGIPSELELPADRPRPAEQSYRGASRSFSLPESLTQELRRLARNEDVTLFMLLSAAFKLLLHRYTNQTDIVIGTPIANRKHPELEGLIGFFVNTLVLRTDLSGDPTFPELLAREREVCLGAYANQDAPFERLVEELQPDRSSGHSPLFQVAFILQNTPAKQLSSSEVDSGLRVSLLGGTATQTAKFDLTLTIEEGNSGLSAAIEFSTELFDVPTVERLAGHFVRLLESIVSDPGCAISRLELLTEIERRQVLFDFNDVVAGYPRESCLQELFEAQVEHLPEAVALVHQHEQLTYRELNARANRLAHYLLARGVGSDTLVGLQLSRSVDMVVALLGVMKAGAAYVALDAAWPPARLRFMLEDAQIRILLTTERLQPREVPSGVEVISLDTERERIASESPHNPACHAAPDNLAYVAYTSGSTGIPKGVAVPQRAVIRLVKGADYVELGVDEVMLQYAPLAFDASTFEIWGSLLNGARLVLAGDGVLSIEELGRVIREQRVTTLWLTAGLFHRMVDQRLEDLRGVRQLLAGGDVLSVRHVLKVVRELPGCRLINGYGPTENTTFTCCHVVTEESELHRSVPIGQAIPGTQVYLLDSNLRPVPVGVAGELYAGGDGLARGYLNRPELTAERFIPHPFNNRGERLYRTGDVARYLPNGVVEFLGRADLQIKLRGFRIELGEIETVLNTHEAVQSAVVVAREVEANEKILVAYVVAQPSQSPSTSELYVYLRERLPEYMAPQAFFVLDELPLMPNGKVDRHKLPEPEQSWPTLAGEYIAPRTPVEEILAAIWGEVLGRKTVSVHDNFFELGGHSLLATQVISRVRDAFGQEVALRSLFEQPTVAGLAREIEVGGGLRADLQAPPLQRVERAERLPLSFAQQRLWFLDQMEPGSASYNIPAAVRLRGVLNVEALERTLSEVVRRHEVLRTHFMAMDGEPVQVIEPAAPIKLEVLDLSGLDEVERTAETERLVAEESARPFDLSRGPLLRMSLLRLGEDEHVALVMMHHIISDGWSIGVLVREVAALYSAYVRGEESPLEELPIQYADFAHWQRNWLQGDVLAAQLDYWHDELDGAPAFIDLPIDKPRPPVQTHRGAHHPLRLSPELSSQLKDLSRQNGSTLFMTLLAAFDLLLSRYAGQEQVLVGSPIANRNRSETEGLIGFFVNTLVLRGDVRGNPSFRELLRRVRETALGAYAHQDLPFEKLVEELQPERDMSRSPLFQVMFVLQNAPGEALELEGLSLSSVESAGDTVKFELMLGLEEVGDTIAGGFNYNRDLYEPETIERLVASYERVLQAVVADAEQRVFEIELLSENERRQIIHGWNETTLAFPRALLLSELFEAQAARTPEAVALRFEDTAYTYRELNERANQLAHYLQRSGVSPDVLVGILMHRSMEMILAVLGILKAGGAYVPLDPSYPRERLAFMIHDAGLRILLTQAELLNEVPGEYVGQTLSLDEQWDAIAGESVENLLSVAHPESLAYVIYTSGSTGWPKGVMIQQRSVAHLATALQQSIYQQYGAGLRIGLSAPLAFDASVKQVVQLLHGHTLCILPEEARADARQLLDYIKRYRLDSLDCTPSHLKLLGPNGVAELLALRPQLVLVGGEALDETVWPQLADSQETRFFNIYGPTECTVDATVSAVRAELPASTIGRPLPNVQVYVLDQWQQPVGIGIAGEIYIGGDGVGRGYLQQPGLTAERFIPHPYSAEEGARLYRTGDSGRYLTDGNIEYLGRLDDQVKLRGFRIELGEIEAVLASHPAVREAAVVLQEDQSGDKRLVAYVAGAEATGLREYLRERVPEYMAPSAFVMLAQLPLTANGKVDRRALPAPDVRSLVLGAEFVAPRTAVEEIVAGIWSQLLGVERIGVADNFFELGGHSLLATQVISRVRDAFGQEVALRSLFEQSTVAGLAQTIEIAQRAGYGLSAPAIVRVWRDAQLPLSFAQQRLWFLDQLEPGSSFYNIPAAVRLRGAVDIEVLERTLSEVVRRHEVLRTRFTAIDGEPVQVIDAAAPLRLEVLDLSGLDEEAREAEMRRLAQVEASLPFDLAHGPLLRVGLIRLGAEEHVALVTMHHIVSDAWSIGIFVREVATLYKAFTAGEESPLEELGIQYADFAHWQRRWLQGEVLDAQLDYWRAELAEAPTVIDLPIDKPRPPVQTYRGAYHLVQLSSELSAQLRDLSRRHGSTLFMTLLAAFDLLLCRYAGQQQVLVGSPIANRNRSETEGLIGFFVNTLVLRGDMRGNPSFGELLRRVREVALGAYAHQDLPFERLVEELQPERDMSRSPLFQVTFTWQNAPSERLELPGLSLSRVESAGDTAKYELMLLLGEGDGEIAGVMAYNRDLFETPTVERLVASYERVLQAVIADAEQRVLQIELLSEAERQQIVAGWNETRSEYRGALTINRLFEAQAARRGEAVALVFEGKQLSYAELDRRSNQLAHHLLSLGVSPDSLVAVCLDRSFELFIALLAILKAGAAYLPLDPSYPLARLSFMLADAGAPLLLTTEALADELPTQWTAPLLLDADWDLIALNSDEPLPETVVAADQLAYVMYTSGSTGTPKGVAVTHAGVRRLVTSPNYVRLDQEQTLLQLAPLTFDASTLEVWGALLNGGRLVVMPPGAPTLDEISRVIVDEGVTTLWLTAGLFHLMVDEQLEGLSQVEQLLAGGDVLSVPHVEKYLAAISNSNRRLINGYGPTENTTFTCCHVMNGNTTLNGSVPIGRPITNTQVYVLDAEMQVVPVGVVGELYIGGAGLARGYFNQPELTAERFVPHPHSTEAGERLYRTGDMVRWRESGELEFIGRVDGQVKIRGFRIEVGEIEAVLAEHSGVREAVVLVREDERGDKRLAAYVVKKAESEVSAGELKEYLRERLPEYMQVQWVVEVAEMPLTANGKVDRRALQELAVETAGGESVQARTPAEEILAAIFAEVLGRETVSVHDNFFDLGGHSLLATQVISRVRDAFGQEVALRSLFEQPTVAGLAREIAAGLGAELQAPPLERVERAERLPLSFAQQRLWFLDQLEPGSSFYNIPAAVRLRGVLNVEALERTLSEVVRRHEVLRTHFVAVDGEPVQVIEPAAPISLEVLDLSVLGEAERTAANQRLIAEEAQQPFDLKRGPLLRVSLIRLGAEEHVALVTMHHIVSDGWSIGVLVREVAALYTAYVRGEESPLEELPIQYADFAHWQRRWLAGEVLDAQLDYWRAELAEAPTVIDLPIDKPRPPVQTYRGAYHPVQLSTELSAQLRDLSRRHGSTLFMTLLAAFDVLLCRYAGQEQVLVGSPIANRNRSETEALIGFFVNTLVLRGDVRGNPSFSELVRRVREVALGAYAHQDLPFEKLVEELQPERDTTRSPLFQVTFTWQNAPGEALELPGLSLSAVASEGDTAKYELMLLLGEGDGVIAGVMAYNRDLFETSTIERLVASYERVLQAVIADAEQRVLQIELLSEAERQQIVAGWNETKREYSGALTLHRLFEAQAARRGEAVALVFEGEQLSYAELDRRSNQLAQHLVSLGVSPDTLVAVCLDRSFELFIALLAILKAGAAYLPLDPSYPLARLSYMLAEAGAPLLLTTEALADELPTQWTAPLLLDADWDLIALNSDEPLPETVVNADQLAYVMYTSGSTGTPKGVAVTHGGVRRLVTSPNYVRLEQEQTLLQLAPLTFDASTLEVWGALLNGGRLVVMPPGAPTLDEISRVIVDEGVTTLWLTAGLFHLMVDEQLEGLSQVGQLLAGGDVLSVPHVEKYLAAISNSNRRLINGYGPTENTTFTCCHVMNGNATVNGSVPIGRPITNTQVYVLDAEMQVVPVGVVGELYIGGAGLARGYFNQPELTAERFVPHSHSTEAGERLYRTGDMVRWRESGELEFIGRVDGQVKIRGFRIEVGEIEAVLVAHAGVREAVVLVREDERGDKRLAAYVVKKAESEVSAGELKEYLRERLPEYMQVQWVVEVEEMPLTANGKVDRRALQELAVEIAGGESVQARTPAEEILAAIFAEVLGRETVSVHDNFFELGGHSLLATQVISRVRDAFGQEVALRSLFEQPTVAGLAQTIEIAQLAGAGLSVPPLVPISRDVELPLSFAQQRLWFLDQLEARGSFYNLPAAVRLRGMLNVEALERTLSEVVRRHEVLRTTFVAVDGRPRQVIEPFTPVVLPVFDVSELNAAEREVETQRLLSEEGARPFDLTRGPLVRACLVRLKADEHVALVTMHHIISDGWSAGVFIREVAALYGAYVRGEESPLEELPIQYADFAHWQRGWLQGAALAAQLDYWREVLAEAPAMLELPTDHPRPREQMFNGAMVSLVVPAELTGQLKELGQRERVTLFMTLLASFQSLLFRHSGQDDILVGTPIANRRYRELEDLIGFFVNTLALRASSLATLTFTELLHRVREVTLGAYAHQDLPFEKLVEELQPERDLSRNPIFQVMFAVQNAPKGVLELPGLTLEGQGVESDATRFDLECHLWEDGPVLSGVFVYNTDLFEQTTIERLVVNYQTLLQSIVANPTEAVASLRLLRAEDERQLLYGWNETSTEYPQPVVHELFAQQVALTPHATALVFGDVSLTFAELNRRSNLLASYLQTNGVGADTVVGVMLERSVEMLMAVLGVLKAGGAYLPLDPEYPGERRQFMLADAGVRVLLTHEQLAGSTSADVEIIRLDTDWLSIVEQSVDDDPRAAVTGDNLAYVIYTSGSTGQPKGVAMTHGPLVNLMHWQMHRSAKAPRTLQFTSLSFDVSFQEIFSTWCAGGTLVLIREEARRDAGQLWRLLIGEQIERLFLPFVALQYLAEASEHNNELPSTLREVITAGEQLKITRPIRSLFAKLNDCTLDNQYGPSETHVASGFMLTGDAADWPELPAIGRPIANAQLYVLDEWLQVVPIGAAGELYIGGAAVARGYLNRATASAEKFLPHPFAVDGSARLYRTGDQARYLADGNIEFLGRRDQQVKVRGYRIELGEVEAALRQQEQVREAVVISSASATGENRLIAYVLTEPETTLTTSGLRGGLKALLPEYMIPAAFVLLEEFPLTPSGKVDRRALQARQVELEAGGASVQARTPAEEIVMAIWAEVLGRDVVGVHDNFFELGGHSLLATQVISRVRDAFGQEVALRSLFEQPTVAGLAERIEQAQRAGAGLLAPPLVRVTGAERLPLSFAQQRLWFLDQMEPGSSSYNIPAAVRLQGALDIAVMERTLSEIMRRHEVLRTRFVAVDGEPVQVIDAATPFGLEVHDLSLLDEEAREAEMLRMVRLEASLPFDLSRGPLLRVSLIRLQTEEHVAAVTMPHIVTDGWSMGIFISEVATLYIAYVRGDESPLEELPIQYSDFAHWQRGWLQGEVLAAQLDYWRAELADAPTVIDLPIDKPRPPIQTYRGAHHRFQLTTELSGQLRDLSRRHGSTLFMTLLAAYDLLLCRYAGQEQVLVGSPIANRNRSETEGLIGFFVNTLVLRGDARGNPSFSELLRRVRETSLSAYAHQDLPFEKLVAELRPDRDMSRSPLFQVMFALQNASSEAFALPGLSLSRVESEGDTAKYELTLVLAESGGVIAGAIEYNRDLFEATTIERLMASYERVLQAVVADAEQRVLEIDLLSEAKRQQIIEGWNDTRREYSGAVTLHRMFEAQAERRGEAVAVVFGGEQLTYAELNRRANQLAHHLISLGVAPDSLVAVCLDRSLELFVALLAILKAGAAYLPLDPSYPLARISFMLADAGAPLLLTTETLAELLTQWTAPLLLDADWDLIALNSDETLPETVVNADQLAYVMYTSGSTGTPKGVAVTHAGVRRLVTAPNYIRLEQEQTLLQLAPLTFDASTLEVWGALLNGARLVVMPPGAPTLDEISRVIVDEGVTTLWLTAGLFHLMVDEQLEGLSQVEQLLAGGDVLSVRHVEKYLAAIDGSEHRLINGYGPTENTTFTCCHVMDGNATVNGSVPIGRPITNTQVYVLDAEMQVVPVGVVGELYIGGAGLARGYFNQPELTAERFVPHPHSTEAGERLYRTGDMVRWRESGELEFIGRVDGQVKIRGFRIEVGEIEAVLAAHVGVREAVVLVREDERGDKRLAAYVVKKAESEVGELKDYLRERLPEYMQVQWVVEVAEMPLTANGKVDRRALQALEVEIERGQTVPARTPAEEILSAIWAEVLGRETVSVHDNFFDLGGHSLLATQVISRVRDAFGQEVALRSLFEQPTVAGLAREIAAGLGAELQAPPLERVERAEWLPLSFAQQRLWFLDQLEPGSSFYNIPAAVRLRGALNVEALERTLWEVVRRHEVLRTHFVAVDGEPVQVIEPASPISLEVLDLSGLDEVERATTTQRFVAEESAQPFDLSRGPLLRVNLLRLQKDEHVALVTMHHIVSDGWSIGILVREVAALYNAYVRGAESPLEELPVQYADFAHWQRRWLAGEVLDAQLDYWRAELADAPTVIDLPIDKPRPPVQTYRGASHPVQLSTELSAQLRDLSRRHGSTLFMTLLAAFDLLLCRYAGQEQVLVGSPIANRNRSETEALIGFFVNTLVLRGDVRGNPSFRELLRRVRDTALGAYAHQDLPFEKLVEELQPDRDMSRSPVFQVMFVLQNAPGEALELEGLTLSGMESTGDTVKFELMLGLQEVGEVVAGGINYNRDLYEAETIERLVASYERVLQAVVADAEQRVFDIDLLSEAERWQVIEGWNETEREYPPALTLSELFEAQAARIPEAVALRFEDTTLSYRELNERANQLARYLQQQGVGPEVLVGILMDRSVEMIVAVLGILKAGGAYVPVDPSYPVERLAFMVQDSGMRMLLTRERLREVPGEYVGATFSLREQWDAIAGESTENLASLAQPENVAYVIYTSGSTGQPKGVLISHENVVRLLEATQLHFDFNQHDVWTLFHSYAFDFSVWEIWGALAYGGRLVIVPYWISRSTDAFHRLLVSEQVTVLNQTPSAFRQLIAADEALDDVELKLRLVIFGGEALELQSLRPWFARHGDHTPRLVNMFGITETTVHVTYRPLTAIDLELAASSVIGRALECLQVYLLDERGQPVPIGVAGEICVGGTGLARGYLNRAELTAERFVPNPFSASPGARLYRSGDLACFLPNGDIEYLGRIDQQVKVRGFRIELGEIEATLAEHEAVRECTVVAAADANGETKLLAYLVAGRQQAAPSVTVLREFLKEKLPEYMIPASFTMLDALPLTANGKIDRKALPAPDQARPEIGKEFIAPRTPAEQILASIWEELLDVRPVGVRDDFFSLGGHSLLAVRLMARIQASFGQHLPLASLFQGPTIEKLATLVHEQPHDHGASALVGIQPNGDGLPFFCVHPGGGNVLCYNELSNHLGFERPFYGLQARGLAENQIPHTRIEDMAAYYIDAIRTVWPDGPYLLGGWSMGGVIAYEMARQLEAQGQQMSLVALLDARPVTSADDAAQWDELTLLTSFAQDLGLPVDGLQLSTDELAKLDSDELLSYVLQRAIDAGVVPGDIQLAHAQRLFEVFKINVQAMQNYRPEASSTRVTLFKADEQEEADETMGWSALTSGEIEIHRVPGSHFTIVREPYVSSLAEQLADCINRATLRSLASHT